ncbi:MAG: arsenate reductase (azurin) small subunit [Armatimonadetes bacterium]|nr:arsenate reductase (azurin) small subunit [Armatimonadota bacterium]
MDRSPATATVSCPGATAVLTRRQALILSGATVATLVLPRLGPTPVEARVRAYPRKRIAQISHLFINQPLEFFYPYEHPHMRNFLFKLGTPAGGGAGRLKDIVAFNSLCTHQGGPLAERYNARHKVFGPCPFHLTTFDLTRHGMVVSGQATQGLPQILLEIEGNDIYAVGVLGLVYGFGHNLTRPGA